MDAQTRDLIARMSKALRGLGQPVSTLAAQELPDDWPVHVGNPRAGQLRGYVALANQADAALAASPATDAQA